MPGRGNQALHLLSELMIFRFTVNNQVPMEVCNDQPGCRAIAAQDRESRGDTAHLSHKKERDMNSDRMIAAIVGVLFIVGTVAGVLSVVFTGSILGDPDYLSKVSVNETQIIIGALLVFIMGFALAMVPVVIFPTLKKHNEILALGYVVFRGALETVTYIAVAISW